MHARAHARDARSLAAAPRLAPTTRGRPMRTAVHLLGLCSLAVELDQVTSSSSTVSAVLTAYASVRALQNQTCTAADCYDPAGNQCKESPPAKPPHKTSCYSAKNGQCPEHTVPCAGGPGPPPGPPRPPSPPSPVPPPPPREPCPAPPPAQPPADSACAPWPAGVCPSPYYKVQASIGGVACNPFVYTNRADFRATEVSYVKPNRSVSWATVKFDGTTTEQHWVDVTILTPTATSRCVLRPLSYGLKCRQLNRSVRSHACVHSDRRRHRCSQLCVMVIVAHTP